MVGHVTFVAVAASAAVVLLTTVAVVLVVFVMGQTARSRGTESSFGGMTLSRVAVVASVTSALVVHVAVIIVPAVATSRGPTVAVRAGMLLAVVGHAAVVIVRAVARPHRTIAAMRAIMVLALVGHVAVVAVCTSAGIVPAVVVTAVFLELMVSGAGANPCFCGVALVWVAVGAGVVLAAVWDAAVAATLAGGGVRGTPMMATRVITVVGMARGTAHILVVGSGFGIDRATMLFVVLVVSRCRYVLAAIATCSVG